MKTYEKNRPFPVPNIEVFLIILYFILYFFGSTLALHHHKPGQISATNSPLSMGWMRLLHPFSPTTNAWRSRWNEQVAYFDSHSSHFFNSHGANSPFSYLDQSTTSAKHIWEVEETAVCWKVFTTKSSSELMNTYWMFQKLKHIFYFAQEIVLKWKKGKEEMMATVGLS